MTKEEKIQEAYGDYYNPNYIDKNGWINQNVVSRSVFDNLEFDSKTNSMRPLELKGIENNNGWIKIESEDDLPKSVNVMYRIGMFLNNGRFHQDKNLCNHKTALEALSWNYTHYQPISESYPPIY